jgi:hypothetical protein
MSTVRTREIAVGVFSDRAQAQQAVAELKRNGFTDDDIGVTSKHDSGTGVAGDADATGSKADEGAVAGLAAGAGVGALWGLGILAGVIPGIGPAIAGGTLGILLSSAAAGAATAGLAGALIGLGIPEDDAGYYEGEFKAGRSIVTVKGPRHLEAAAILTRFGGYDSTAPRATPVNPR